MQCFKLMPGMKEAGSCYASEPTVSAQLAGSLVTRNRCQSDYYVHVGASAILDLGLQSRVMRRMHVIDAGTRFVVMLLAGPPCHRN